MKKWWMLLLLAVFSVGMVGCEADDDGAELDIDDNGARIEIDD